MTRQSLDKALLSELKRLEATGTLKGRETSIAGVVPAAGTKGPRYLLEGEGDRQFIRMNSNSYLGMSLRPEVIQAGEEAVRAFGTGPGAVRFISGTWSPHVELERKLAAFHGREAAMIFNSAYATVMGILPPLITDETAVISDELNHNCIINAIRLAHPKEKYVYSHLDMAELEHCLAMASRTCRRAIVVTDGIFSMRGDNAPLGDILKLARAFDGDFTRTVSARSAKPAAAPKNMTAENWSTCWSQPWARHSALTVGMSLAVERSSITCARRLPFISTPTRSRRAKLQRRQRPWTLSAVRRGALCWRICTR
jgi:glycine C-acetyltransferase